MVRLVGFAADLLSSLVRGVLILSFVKLVLSLSNSQPSQTLKRNFHRQFLIELIGPISLLILARCWLEVVTLYVPEPYLDEVFHIPQAQVYCQGRYYDWDDKITTPPGLYVLAILFNRGQGITICTTESLRSFNVYAISLLALLVSECRSMLESHNAKTNAVSAASVVQLQSFYSMHTALNIGLFPVLFFFSGLYYTDIASTLTVLLCYRLHLGRTVNTTTEPPSWPSNLLVIVLGLVALAMRQTNVFWVVVFMGGLEVVHAVKTLRPAAPEKVTHADARGSREVLLWYLQRYAEGDVHDPPINLAWADDILISIFSLAVAAISNPVRVLRQIWPYITVLSAFGAFVAWNGGVVLGDKSNHIATIHLAQMLYIWPLIFFFSFPLCLSLGFQFAICIATYLSEAHTKSQSPPQEAAKKDQIKSRSEVSGSGIRSQWTQNSVLTRKTYVTSLYVVFLALLITVVKFNTIIHPFTLADNRHYMFYIFRYTIRRAWWVRYALLFLYWMSMASLRRCLAGCQPMFKTHSEECPVTYQKGLAHLNSPFMDFDMRNRGDKVEDEEGTSNTVGNTGRNKSKVDINKSKDEEEDGVGLAEISLSLSGPSSGGTIPPTTSTEAIWVLTSALSLITAPLVEPRYFILPWVFWRLHVPAWRVHDCGTSPISKRWMGWVEPIAPAIAKLGKRLDIRLFLETVWLLLVNAVTMYIFIAKPFFWFDSEHNLGDEGRMQRFMW